MFYSHEVLTSRKYGVATVWLVATLGNKSALKKVSRRAILDVDVLKACQTISEPDIPMALRLQSNLLYGVSRVYSEQCGYVLHDAQTAQNNMRLLFKVMRTSALEAEGGHKGHSDQLILQDDPNFMPDFDLIPFDLENFDMTTLEDSQRSSNLSPRSSQLGGSAIGSQQSIGGLLIPPSASSFVGGPGGFGSFGGTRVGSGLFQRDDQEGLYDDDLGLNIAGDQIMVDDGPVRQPRVPSGRADHTLLNSNARNTRLIGRADQGILGQQDQDGYMPLLDDDYTMLPEADAFSAQPHTEEQQHTTSETADAPIRRQRRAAPKVVPMDATTELRNSELARWNNEYLATMAEGINRQHTARVAAQAKKNAEFWMLGPKLHQADRGPLYMYSGVALLERLTGIKFMRAGDKHPRDDDDETDIGHGRRVRSRGEPSSDQIGRGGNGEVVTYDDDGYVGMPDDTIEQGREQPTPLANRHLSNTFPWNQSTGSRRPTGIFSAGGYQTSVSAGGAGLLMGPLSRRGSRLVSASPLMGRGAAPDEGALDDYQLPGSADDFEAFGPAANVDTQTAEQSQWQRAALDGESVNFLGFVQTGIEEADQAREGLPAGDEEYDGLHGSVAFDQLLLPERNSRIVAAQGLLHVLALGTKNLLAVEQEEAFGAITMRLIAAE